jgi:hypothetical protein
MRLEKWQLNPRPMSMRLSSSVFEGQVIGFVYGNPKFEDGSWVRTSDVVELDPEFKFAKTRNSLYELGEPAVATSAYIGKWGLALKGENNTD